MNRSTRLCRGAISALCVLALWACGDATNSNESDTADLAVKPDKVKKIEVGNKLIAVLYDNGAIEKTSIDFQFSPIPSGTYEDIAISNEHVCLIAKKSKKLTCYKIETALGIFKERKPPIDNVEYSRVWAGDSHFCATRQDNGPLACWGQEPLSDSHYWFASGLNNPVIGVATTDPLLQNNSAAFPRSFLYTVASAVAHLSISGLVSCVTNTQGAAACFGENLLLNATQFPSCLGGNRCFDGQPQETGREPSSAVPQRFQKAVTTKSFTCALKTDGSVFCSGNWLDENFGENMKGNQFQDLFSGYEIICAKNRENTIVCSSGELRLSTRPKAVQASMKLLTTTSNVGVVGMSHSSVHEHVCLLDNKINKVVCVIEGVFVPWQDLKGKDMRKGIHQVL